MAGSSHGAGVPAGERGRAGVLQRDGHDREPRGRAAVGPLSGEPCVNYILRLERDSSGESSGYTEVSEVRTYNEFIVDEGSARIRFESETLEAHPETSEYPFQVHATRERVEDESDIPE